MARITFAKRLVFALALAGCTRGNFDANGTSGAVPLVVSEAKVAPTATPAWHLFVANNAANTITWYAPGGTAALGTISQNLDGPVRIRFGKQGALYALNCGSPSCGYETGGFVTVYAAKTYQYVRTVTQGVDGPAGIALDSQNNLYVTNALGNDVTKYAPGTNTVALTIHDGVADPTYVAIDSQNRVYVANCLTKSCGYGEASVTVYAGATGKLLETIGGLADIGALEIGPDGDLYVASNDWASHPTYVGIYPWGALKPTRKLDTQGLSSTAIAFGAGGNVYAAECPWECGYYSENDGLVYVFGPKGNEPIRTIKSGLVYPTAMAVADNGYLYVADWYADKVFAYPPGGKEPSRVIESGVDSPFDVRIGP
jgi:sugar lactone lactonase YvrE